MVKECERCGNGFETETVRMGNLTMCRSKVCPKCEATIIEEEAAQKEQEEKRAREQRRANVEKLLARAGVPRRYLVCSFENFFGKLPGWIRDPEKKMPSFITGPPGVGKTHIAVALLREELIKGGKGTFIRMVDLLKEIKECYDDKSVMTESTLLNHYGTLEYLVIDDLGAEKVTEWTWQTVYDLIDRRYGEMLPTTITSNLTLEDLGDLYSRQGERIASRIAGSGEMLTLAGVDKRLLRKKQH